MVRILIFFNWMTETIIRQQEKKMFVITFAKIRHKASKPLAQLLLQKAYALNLENSCFVSIGVWNGQSSWMS